MRSVFVHFQIATEAEVIAFMDKHFHRNRADDDDPHFPLWVVSVNDDPCLYIDFYRDMNSEYDVEQWFDLQERLGGEPNCTINACISGRHPGTEQVFYFVTTLLRQFQGLAEDEYYDESEHFWTLEELEQGVRVKNHPFFDYNGWYEEDTAFHKEMAQVMRRTREMKQSKEE